MKVGFIACHVWDVLMINVGFITCHVWDVLIINVGFVACNVSDILTSSDTCVLECPRGLIFTWWGC